MKEKSKVGYLIMNTGTPDETSIPALRRYLKQFLSDPDMLDYPSQRLKEYSKGIDVLRNGLASVLRWIIVNLIVLPFRPARIQAKYQGIWTKEGSPLLVNTIKFAEKLKKYTNENVEIGMRYGNPSIEKAIKKFKENEIDKLFLVSMFPQYAEATSGSTFTEVERVLKKEGYSPNLIKINHYYNEEFYLKSLKKSIIESEEYKNSEYLLFSFHGLPVRQLKKSRYFRITLPKGR